MNAEEKYKKREMKELMRVNMWNFRVDLVKEALDHLKGKIITTKLIKDTIMNLNEGEHLIDRWEI